MWDKIAELLEKNNMNRNQLAKVIGVSYGNIQDWKSGKCNPSYKALMKIADFFGVPMNYFLDDETPDDTSDYEPSQILFYYKNMSSEGQERLFELAQLLFGKYNKLGGEQK